MFVPPWKLKSKGLTCPCNPASPPLPVHAARGCLCRFSHPRWPKRLLPVLISGLQSTPKTPTRHAPYEWLIQILTPSSSLSCQVSISAKCTITAATSAGRWRGGVSFPAAKRRIGPIACGFCSFHHCSAQDRVI